MPVLSTSLIKTLGASGLTNVGSFATLVALQAAWPSPQGGLFAVTGIDGVPGGESIYVSDGGVWTLASGGGSGSGDVTGPASAVAGNFPSLDATGKILSDSGSKAADFATAAKFIAGAGALTGPAAPLTIGTAAASAVGDFATSSKFVAGAGALTGPASPLTIGTAAASAVGDFATSAKFVAGAGALTGPAAPLTIGTAAASAVGDFATAAQGSTANTAVQSIVAGTNVTVSRVGNSVTVNSTASGSGDVTGPASAVAGNFPSLDATGKILSDSGKKSADFATAAQGGKADTAVQPAALAAYELLANKDTDVLLAANSDTKYPSQRAVKSYGNTKKPYHGFIGRDVGVSNPLPTSITTTTFTLGAAANTVLYYYRGTQVTVSSNKTTTLSGAAGLYFIYFDAATGNLLNSTVFPGVGFADNVLIATVFWNGTNYGLVNDERHGYTRDTSWHTWAHNTVGVRYRSGLTLTHNGGTGNAATFATTAGEIADEDIQFAISASSAFPTANAGRLLYQTGASTYAFVNAPSTVPGYLGANNRPNVVSSTGYALTELASAPNRYINVFVYATTDLHTPVYFFTETASAATVAANGYTSVANARAVGFPNLSSFGLSAELKPIYRLIWRADGVLQAIDTTQDDYRLVSSLPQSAGTTSTTAAAVSFNPAGNVSATTVQTAIEELDTEKQPVCEEKTTSFTAAIHGNYIVTGTATVTDPTPEAGHGFTVLVRNGTVTVGGTEYAVVNTRIERTYHSGAWSSAVWYPVTGGEGTATHVLTSNGTGAAPSFQDPAVSASSTTTLTNKRVTKRLVTVTQSATPSINTDNTDIASITGLAQAITSMTTGLTGTPVNGDMLMVQITDNGTARAIAWGASFVATSSFALPTTTVISTLLRVLFQWNSVTSKWECVGTA
jgi:hypothetical protein